MATRQKRAPSATKPLEATLWEAADKLRGNLEAAEYKHVVLGLVFLKYVSDAFEVRRKALESALSDTSSADFIPSEARRERILESRDEYTSHNVFWVPDEARWGYLQDNAKSTGIGQLIDSAMDLVEKENPHLKGVLPKNFGRADLDKRLLGELVDLIGSIGSTNVDHGSDDVLGKVYEYFLGKFAGQEGRGAGEFYTPRSVVRLLVEMLEPYKGRVYDPCCGSGGMFVQSEEFVLAHGGKRDDLSIYGQEFVATTWRLGKMNLALRGIEADLGDRSDDSFHRDLHPDLRADFILANPPFNKDDWYSAALADDARWQFGSPPSSNANFAWVQHIIHHLAPGGTAGFVLANGSLTSNQSGEGEIRKHLVDADLVDCIVSLPSQLFLNTQISVSLWFIAKNRHGNGHRERSSEVLMIDARNLGKMENRRQRVLTSEDISEISSLYQSWRSKNPAHPYVDIDGFSKAATIDEIKAHGYMLAPGRYVGARDFEQQSEPLAVKIARLHTELLREFAEGRELEDAVTKSLEGLEYVD